MDISLGDNQQPWLFQERHDLGSEFHKLVAAPEHAQFARAHDAERTLEIRFKRLAIDAVVAHTQESEVVRQ